MSLADFSVVNEDAVSKPRRYQTKAGNTAINAGEMVIQGTGGDVEYVTTIADGDSDTATWVGVASTTDTVTASADGEVWVWDDPAQIIRGQATTPANLAATSLLTKVTFDVSGTDQRLDENDTSNGVALILDYDRVSSTPEWVDFRLDQGDSISA